MLLVYLDLLAEWYNLWVFNRLFSMQSSAKRRVLDGTQSDRSWINNKNIRGQRTVPWGTPLMTGMP